MSPEKQRIAIAEACGWRRDVANHWRDPDGFYRPTGEMLNFKAGGLPDFLNDLNAMHEAEKMLGIFEACGKYLEILYKICEDPACFATAAQRAEAFLRTIAKWEDS